MGYDKRKLDNFLKCASINVRSLAKETTLKSVKEFIHRNKCNLVLLQEIKNKHDDSEVKVDWEDDFKDFKFISTHKHECGILVHERVQFTRIEKLQTVNFGNQWMTWIIVFCVGLTILVGSYYRSPNPRVANGHGEAKQADMRLIKHEIDEIRLKYKFNSIMIGGDMNVSSTMWDAGYTGTESQETKNVIDFIEQNELIICNDNYKPTHAKYNVIEKIPSVNEYNVLDLTLVSNNLLDHCSDWTTNSYNYFNGEPNSESVKNCELDAKWLAEVSDHFAVTWNINCKIQELTDKYSWRLNSTHWNCYRDMMEINSLIWCNKFDKYGIKNAPIDDLTNELTIMMRESARTTIGIKKYTNNSVTWFNRKIGKTIATLKKLKRKREDEIKRRKKKQETKKAINFYKRLRNKLELIAKKDVWWKNTKYLNENIDNPKIFNKKAKKITRRENAGIGPLFKNDGTLATTTMEKAQIMHNYFTKKHKENEYSQDNINFHNYVKTVMDHDDEIEPEQFYGRKFKSLKILNRKITEQEIWKAIKTLKRDNAMGPDAIHNIMILEAVEQLIPIFIRLFNAILEQGYHPFLWRISEFVGMPKPGKDPKYVKNIRALQMISTLDRILQKIFTWRILAYCNENGILQADNCAYQQNKATSDMMFQLDEDSGQIRQATMVLNGAFLDFSKAFDTICRSMMLYKTKHYYGIKGKIHNWLKSFLSNRYTRVRLNGKYTKWKKQELGVPQGGPISALLFIIYVNDCKPLKDYIMRMIKYADDTSLWNVSMENRDKLRLDLQCEIDRFIIWAADWKLIVNYDKCETFCITRKRKYIANDFYITKNDDNNTKVKLKKICNIYNRSEDEIKYNRENNIKNEDSFRILGFYMKCNGNMKVMIDRFIGLCNLQFMKLRSFVNYKHLRLNSAAIWKLGRPIFQALIEYGALFYSKESKTAINKIYNWQYKLARYCIGARSSCPKRYLEYELNFDDIETRVMIQLMENYEAAKRAPMTYMKGVVFDDWINYMYLQDSHDLQRWKNEEKTHSKTVLSRGYKLWRRLNDKQDDEFPFELIQPNDVKEVKYSLPVYLVNFPQNISLFKDFDSIAMEINNFNSMNWWTDGSVKHENYGGFGMATLQQRKIGKWVQNYGWIDHLTNIEYCELVAIYETLNEMCNDDDFIDNKEMEYLTILTDSMFCIYQLDLQSYCKYEYYYNILMKIFTKCNFLWQYGKHIRIVKVPAHQGITGNEIADYWANVGADMAFAIDRHDHYIRNNDIPLIVQNEINKRKIRKMRKEEREIERKEKENEARRNNKKRVGSTLYGPILDNEKNGSKHVLNEKKYLSFCQTAIIARLRSEHIELNKYNNIIYRRGEQTSDKCEFCNQIETVSHFIRDCNKFIVLRNVMIDELREYNSEFNLFDNNNRINVRNLLFPHDDQKDARKIENILKRVKILKTVCKFVINTGRFNRDNVRTKIFKQYGKIDIESREIEAIRNSVENAGVLDNDIDDEINDEQIEQININFDVLGINSDDDEIIDDNG